MSPSIWSGVGEKADCRGVLVCLSGVGRDHGSILVASANDALTYAGINGTILALLFAVILAYAVIVFQTRDGMVQSLLERANYRPLAHTVDTSFQWAFDIRLAQGLTPDERFKVMNALLFDQEVTLAKGVVLPRDDRAVRGQLLTWLLYFESEADPFKHDQFDGLNQELRDWQITSYRRAVNLRFALDSADTTDLMSAADDYWQERVAGIARAPGVPPKLGERLTKLASSNARTFERSEESIGDWLDRLGEIGQAIRKLDDYDRRVIPGKLLTVSVCVAVLAAFGCGVAAPMFTKTTPTVVASWIPAGIYAASLLVAAVWALRRVFR